MEKNDGSNGDIDEGVNTYPIEPVGPKGLHCGSVQDLLGYNPSNYENGGNRDNLDLKDRLAVKKAFRAAIEGNK